VPGGDGLHGGVHRAATVGVEPAGAPGGGQQLQGFPERVELELAVDPVAGLVAAPGVTAQVESLLVGYRAAGDGVGGFEVRAVLQQPGRDETDGGVEQLRCPGAGRGHPGVGLVADPGAAVVVVAALPGPFGQAHRGRGDHPAPGTGQPAQHRVGVPGVAGGDRGLQLGHAARPRRLGRRPRGVRVHELIRQGLFGDLEHQVVVLTGLHGQLCHQQLPVGVRAFAGAGVLGPGETPVQTPAVPAPHPSVLVQRTGSVPAEAGAGFEHHPHPGGTVHGDNTAQQHHPVGVAGKREGFAALDDPVVGNPAGTPDEAAVFVVAAPHVAHILGGDGKGAAAADQRGEHSIGIPVGGAHPGDVPLRSDQGAAFAVGEQRVLAQHVRRVHLLHVDTFLGAHAVAPRVARGELLLSSPTANPGSAARG